MAKVTNTFIKSKLNKDLDARLIPNGEYRDAVNVQVSRSEGDSVGSLENVLGNIEIKDFGNSDLTCIGYFADEATGMIYVFLTDYTDPAPNTQRSYSTTAENYIYSYNTTNDTSVLLVQGAFLNFSKTNPIFGINLLEEFLFWTDNRNQPRKININLANPSAFASPIYYTNEDQISVAKYNPYKSMEIYQEVGANTGIVETTMKDVVSLINPNGGTALANVGQTSATINIDSLSGDIIKPNQSYSTTTGSKVSLRSNASPFTLTDTGETVTNYQVTNGVVDQVTLSGSITVSDNQMLVFNPNENYDANFAGDPEYLSDLFVRFSYRFKFEDGEYSLMAPFTQLAFIPKQDGYFMYVKKDGVKNVDDQSEAHRSTIVSFVENKINEIKLVIPRPSESITGGGFAEKTLSSEFKISEIDILYKESDGLAVNVVDTLQIENVTPNSYGDIEYEYKSTKPFQTLPSDELIRVYDKTPVRSLGQEVSGNRVIYANFQNKHTPPKVLDYNVSATVKSNLSLDSGSGTVPGSTSGTTLTITNASGTIEPGSYIIGTGIIKGTVVVSTTGSPVTSITISNAATNAVGAMTFRPASDESVTVSKVEYPNSSLKQNRNYQVGIVLCDRYGRQSSVILNNSNQPSTIYHPYFTAELDQTSWPGDSIKILFNSPIGPENADQTDEWPGLYNGDASSSAYNPLGWYSYKVVVKQTEQEYYNVYLPGIMAAYPEEVTLELGSTSHTVLINDNINKIPRDLSEVGPDQKQFRSSVRLFGRIENTDTAITTSPNNFGLSNKQYYPSLVSDTASMISTMRDMFDYETNTPPHPNDFPQFYDYESNPLIARISTVSQIGQVATTNYKTASGFSQSGVNDSVNVTLTNLSGIPEAGMVVTFTGSREGITIISYNSNNNTVELSLAITIDAGVELFFTQSETPGIQYLAVYETEPVDSQLDIYWETSTSGLISSLNKAILDGTNGGSSFSSFNTNNWSEALASGGDILNAGFTVQNSLGSTITFNSPDVFELVSVINGAGQNVQLPSSVGPYFEMYLDSGAYKIRTKSGYFNNVYYSADANLREFTFNFRSVVYDANSVSTTTLFSEFTTVNNVAQTITASPTSGTTINTNRNNLNTLVTLSAVNGANNTNLAGKDLTWNIVSQKVTGDTTNTQVNYFELTTPVVGNTSATTLKNISSSTEVKSYDLVISCSDPGSVAQVSYVINMAPVVGFAREYKYIANVQGFSVPTEVVVIFISGGTDTANVGYYLIAPSSPFGNSIYFSSGSNNLVDISGGGTASSPIQLNKTGASLAVANTCNVQSGFVTYFNTDLNTLLSLTNTSQFGGACRDSQNPFQSVQQQNEITDLSEYAFEII